MLKVYEVPLLVTGKYINFCKEMYVSNMSFDFNRDAMTGGRHLKKKGPKVHTASSAICVMITDP